jgi:hypothetical protein
MDPSVKISICLFRSLLSLLSSPLPLPSSLLHERCCSLALVPSSPFLASPTNALSLCSSDIEHCQWSEPIGQFEDKYWPECRVCSSELAAARAMELERLNEGGQRI